MARVILPSHFRRGPITKVKDMAELTQADYKRIVRLIECRIESINWTHIVHWHDGLPIEREALQDLLSRLSLLIDAPND